MDDPNKEYTQPDKTQFDDETLEKEFADPQEALDYDGDLVFYDSKAPRASSAASTAAPPMAASVPPKKKGGKGMVFLVIAAVLLVCSAVFAVLMFMRMNSSKSDAGSVTEPVASTSVTEAAQSTAPGDNGSATPDSAKTEQPTTKPPVEGSTGLVTLEEYFRNSDAYEQIKDIPAQNTFHVDDDVVKVEITFDGDAKSDSEAEKQKFEKYIEQLEAVCGQLEGKVVPMREATGEEEAIIYILAFDSKHNENFFEKAIYS